MLKSGTFELRLKVKSVHHIVRSNPYNIIYRLHAQFQENAEESMQLSTLYSMVATRFLGSNISVIATSRLVTDVFPNMRVKRVGKKRVSIIIGIELWHQPSPPFPPPPPPPDTAGSPPFPPDTAGSPPFPPDTAGSPPFPGTSSSLSEAAKITALQLELAVERDRRAALELEIDMLKKRIPAESEVQSAAQYQQLLCSEVDSAVCSRQMLLHGPDTVERFAEFSMSAVITEVQASCPQLYQLVQQLGCTQRNARDGCLPDEELKGVMVVSTLLNVYELYTCTLQSGD